MNNDLYSEHILEEVRCPFAYGILESCTSETIYNNICGDELTLYLDIDDKAFVRQSGFVSSGCALSTAGGSLLLRWLQNKSVEELKLLTPGDVYTMFGVQTNPQRSNCILLAYGALQKHLIRHTE